jgi:uncharacterized protein with gpF-like domain
MPKRPEYLNLAFKQAINYFKRKQVFPSSRGTKYQEGMHKHAFMVQGLTKANLLEDIRWLLEKALEEGTSHEDFTRSFNRLVGRKGWQPGGDRVQKIFITNIRQAYRGGRYEQIQDVAAKVPGGGIMWMHRTPDPELGGNPRPEHKELDGKVFPSNSPFWDKAFPQCAWGCRCGAVHLSPRQIQTLGKQIEAPPDADSIADPGFRYAPINDNTTERTQFFKDGLKQLSPSLRAATEKDLQSKGVL